MSHYRFAYSLLQKGWPGSLCDLGLLTHRLAAAGISSEEHLQGEWAQIGETAAADMPPSSQPFVAALAQVGFCLLGSGLCFRHLFLSGRKQKESGSRKQQRRQRRTSEEG